MQTTEIFVEQLIIGLMALIAILLLAAPEAASLVTKPDIGTGVMLLSGAYVAGILFDRYADSVLGDLEQHQRLLKALDVLEERDRRIPEGTPAFDPFPEDTLRIRLLRDEHVAPYGNYLRSRIRLMRALATLLPALAIGVALWGVDVDRQRSFWLLPRLVFAAYGGLFLWCTLLPGKLPKTNELTTRTARDEYRGSFRWKLAALKAPIASVVLAIFATALLVQAGARNLMWVPAGAFLGSLFAGWAWWRITKTYQALLLKL